jgi:nucleotide-binding universal stress UspA family protein
MKSILVLIGGGERDQVVFNTALAAARPLSGHLDCLHIHVTPGEAARHSRVEFARGPALRQALDGLETKARTFSQLARDNIEGFCASSAIPMCEAPSGAQSVTASFREEMDNAIERLVFHARHSDLVVMGRSKQKQGLPPDALARLIMTCGRPMLIAASTAPQELTGTAMVCWTETGSAARAVAAALPILSKAKHVVFTCIAEREDTPAEPVKDVARRFAWNGPTAEAKIIAAGGRKIPDALAKAAEECGADLIVMGAYGQSSARKFLFGSCTEAFLGHADRPILLIH